MMFDCLEICWSSTKHTPYSCGHLLWCCIVCSVALCAVLHCVQCCNGTYIVLLHCTGRSCMCTWANYTHHNTIVWTCPHSVNRIALSGQIFINTKLLFALKLGAWSVDYAWQELLNPKQPVFTYSNKCDHKHKPACPVYTMHLVCRDSGYKSP